MKWSGDHSSRTLASGTGRAELHVAAGCHAEGRFPSCLPWLVFGATLQRFLRTPRARRVLKGAMAVLLVASTIPLVWTRL